MRTEYTVVLTNKKGAKSYSTYCAKKYAEELFTKTEEWAAKNNNKMELYENKFIGNSLYTSKLLKTNY